MDSHQHEMPPVVPPDDAWLTNAFNSSINAIALTDLEGRLTHVNRAFLKLVGCIESQDVLGRPASDFWGSRRAAAKIRKAIVADGCWFGEFAARRVDNSQFMAQMSATLMADSTGRPIGMLGSVIDVTERVTAQVALQESEAKFRAIFEAEPDCVMLLDEAGKFLDLNPAGLSAIGADRMEHVLGQDVRSFIVPTYHDTFTRAVAKVLGGAKICLEYELLSLDGTRKWMEQHVVGLRDHQTGRVQQMLAVSHDTTLRKRAETIRKESEERFRAIFEQAAAGVALIDARTSRFLRVNDQFCKLLGYTRGEVKRICCTDISHPDDLSLDLACRERIRRGELEQFTMEKRLFRKDGAVIWVNQAVSPLRLNGAKASQYIIVLQDITEQKRAELAMRESEARLAEAQRIAHIGSWEWDIPSDSLIWSDEVYRIFGYLPQSFTPRYDTEFMNSIHPDDREIVSQAVAESLRTGQTYAVTHRVVLADGSQRTVRETGEVVFDPARRPMRMIGNVQDITDLAYVEEQTKRLRDQLAHVARIATMSEMATGLAHEFNQPLAAISYYVDGALDALRRGDVEPQTLVPALDEIGRLTTRCGDIVKRLRRLVAKQPPQISDVDVNRLVADVLTFLEHLLRGSEIPVHLDLCPTLPILHVDAIQMQQVLINIIRNAIEAQAECEPARRELVIRTRVTDARRVDIVVSDRGKGLSPSVASRLFQPFFTTKPTGLGMGLKICQSILLDHGGDLTFAPREGGGAEFIVSLPINWNSRI